MKKIPRRLEVANAAANLAIQPLQNRMHQGAVVAHAAGRIQIDQLHQRIFRKALDPILKIRELQFLFFALRELDNLASHQVDRRNQHGHLTGTFAACSSRFRCSMLSMWKWKMEAARAASACPSRKTSTKWLTEPAPPEAMTGIETACATARTNSQSKPARVPSWSIEVSKISPAPRASDSRAH